MSGNVMKAMVLTRYGSADALAMKELPKPRPKAGHALVKVRATTVNEWDWALMRGKPFLYRLMSGLIRPRVRVLGAEVAGTVEAVGEGVARLSLGDRVFGDISEAGFGGFAEYVCLPECALFPMTPNMSFEQAAALPHAGLLAWQGLVEVGRIQRGETVLINGAGGGVGTLGVQIAKGYGCAVTGVDRGLKRGALLAMGFEHVIDYEETDFTAGHKRYDLILDAKTTRSPARYLKALNPGGRYVTVGGSLPRLLQLLCMGRILSRRTGKRLAILALKVNQGLEVICQMHESGALSAVIDGPYPLADAPQALERFGRAEHVGKIVINVA